MPKANATQLAAEIGKTIGRHKNTVLRWHRRGHIRGYPKNKRVILFDLIEVKEDMVKNKL